MSAWDNLSMYERHQFIRTAVRNGIRDPLEIRKQYNSFAEGGDVNTEPVYNAGALPEVIITPDEQYNEFLNSLPPNQKYTPETEYSTHKYWELWDRPKNFEYTLKHPNKDGQYMYTWDDSDKSYHGNSIAWGKDGVGYFMKNKNHPSLQYELDYYQKGLITEPGGRQRKPTKQEQKDLNNLRKRYSLDTSEDFYKYVPRKKAYGGPLNKPFSHNPIPKVRY